MTSLAVRVATRYRVAGRFLLAVEALPSGRLGIGDTIESEKIRIHRYSGSIRITDLTNAGKRGKRVEEITVFTNGMTSSLLDDLGELITAKKTFQEMEKVVETFLVDHSELQFERRPLRGVDVEPHGEKFVFKIDLKRGGNIQVDVTPHSFHVVDHAPYASGDEDKPAAFFQDTGYWPRKKQDAQIFYVWMKEHVAKVKKFTSIQEFKAVWQGLNVHYDFH